MECLCIRSDPRDELFEALFVKLDPNDDGRLTRQEINALCATAKIDHMLAGELDKTFKSMKDADINRLGVVNPSVFCSWCASDNDVAQRLASAVVKQGDVDLAHLIWERLLGEDPVSQVLPVTELAGLTDMLAEANLKLKKRELDLIMEEIDEDGKS